MLKLKTHRRDSFIDHWLCWSPVLFSRSVIPEPSLFNHPSRSGTLLWHNRAYAHDLKLNPRRQKSSLDQAGEQPTVPVNISAKDEPEKRNDREGKTCRMVSKRIWLSQRKDRPMRFRV